MATAKRTLALLDELEALGFSDQAFRTLHHFDDATIASHRAYCERTDSFQDDGTNERVQRRLEIVLRCYWSGGFKALQSAPEVFHALAVAAVAEVPKG